MTHPISRLGAALALTPLALPAMAEISALEMADVLRNELCRVEVADLQGMVEARGYTAAEAQSAMIVLFQLGASTVADDGALWLEPAYCRISDTVTAEAALVAALRLNGCSMSEDEAEALLAPFGLNRENTTPVVEALTARGAASLVNNEELILEASLCAGADTMIVHSAAAPPAPQQGGMVQQLIDIASENECRIDETTAERVFDQIGIAMADAEAAAEQMIDAGQATLTEDVFVVLPPYCEVGGANTTPALESSDPVALRDPSWPAFRALFEAHGCAMAFEPASLVAEQYGLDLDAGDELADHLMDAGLAEVGGDVLMLDPTVCTPDVQSDFNMIKLDLMMTMMNGDCSGSLIDVSNWIVESGGTQGDVQRVISAMQTDGTMVRDGLTLRLQHLNCG